MSSGSNVTLSLSKVTIDSVEIIAANQFASETGPVVVFNSDNTEVTRSSNITVSQNNVSVTISGLDSYTKYTAKFYNNDSAMFSDSAVTFTTLDTNKIYGGVSGAGARQITDIYGGSNSGAQRITKLYGSVTTTTIDTAVGTVREGGVGNVATLAGRIFVDTINTISLPSYALSYLGLRYDGAYFNLTLSFSDGTPTETLTGWVDESALFAWGIVLSPGAPSIGTDYIDLTVTSSTSSKAKLVHQGFGHNKYFGKVVYYTDSTYTTTDTGYLQSQQEVDTLGGSSGWSGTIDGVSVRNDKIVEVTLYDGVTSLRNFFLNNCAKLSSVDISRAKLTSIGVTPFYTSFGTIADFRTFSVNVGNIDPSIIADDTSSTKKTLAVYDEQNPRYQQGTTIIGSNRAAWLSAFPNLVSSSPYRKLIDAGY